MYFNIEKFTILKSSVAATNFRKRIPNNSQMLFVSYSNSKCVFRILHIE